MIGILLGEFDINIPLDLGVEYALLTSFIINILLDPLCGYVAA